MNYNTKEKPLQETILNMQNALKDINIEIKFNEQHSPLKSCYWLNLSYKYASNHIYSNGKGTSKDASIASALGEFIERLQTNNFFNDFYLPNRIFYPDEKLFNLDESGYLNKELLDTYNPQNQLSPQDLIDFNSNYKEKIVTLPFIEQNSNDKVYFPISILNNLYVSNGMASGNSATEAKVQALSEILERYVKNEIIKNGYSLPEIPKQTIKNFKNINENIKQLQEAGFKVSILDASLGGKFPVVAISLINQKEGTLFVSFGSHPQLEVAITRTLTELMQGRKINALNGFEIPTFDLEYVSSNINLESHFIDSSGKLAIDFLSQKRSFEYKEYEFNGSSIKDEYDYLVNIITKLNKKIYIREYNYLNFYTCQIIVPTLSEIYPIDDLIYNNQNIGKEVRDIVLSYKKLEPSFILDSLEHIDDSLDVGTFIGVIFKKPFDFYQFKAQIYLLQKEYSLASSMLEFSTKTKLNTLVKELLIAKERGLELSNFKVGLTTLFGKELLDLALDIINLKEDLIDITYLDEYIKILELYDKLGEKKSAV